MKSALKDDRRKSVRKRASAVDFTFDEPGGGVHPGGSGAQGLPHQAFFPSPGRELPEPIAPTILDPGPPPPSVLTAEDVFINIGPNEITRVEGPETVRHRRCSSDTFMMLLNQLAEPELVQLETHARRPTVDSVLQDDILRALDEHSVGLNLSPGALPKPEGGRASGQGGAGAGVGGLLGLGQGPMDMELGGASTSGRSRGQTMPAMASSSKSAEALSAGAAVGVDLKAEGLGRGQKRTRDKRGSSGGTSQDDTSVGNVQRSRALSLVDEKKAKRILANRISAQKSRVRKMQFVGNLESTVSELYKDLSLLQPQLDVARKQKQSLALINQELKSEIERLERGDTGQ